MDKNNSSCGRTDGIVADMEPDIPANTVAVPSEYSDNTSSHIHDGASSRSMPNSEYTAPIEHPGQDMAQSLFTAPLDEIATEFNWSTSSALSPAPTQDLGIVISDPCTASDTHQGTPEWVESAARSRFIPGSMDVDLSNTFACAPQDTFGEYDLRSLGPPQCVHIHPSGDNVRRAAPFPLLL